MSKHIKLIAVILVLLLFMTGCTVPVPEATSLEASQEAISAEKKDAADELEIKGIGSGPIMITAFGQSADVAMLKALFTKAELNFEYNPVVTAEELGDTKTLVIAAGASTKGLGAASIKPEDELIRSEAIMDYAKENDLIVVVAHLGGASRRGELSDQFIHLALRDAKAMVVVAEGNEDDMFSKISEERLIPLAVVESISKVVGPVKEIFGK